MNTNENTNIEYLKSLSVKSLKEKVKEIKAQLPKEQQNVITFSKNFTISISNYCQNQCGYCFYNYKVPKIDKKDNIILINNEEIIELIRKALANNCKEALLMSGEKPYLFPEVEAALLDKSCFDYVRFVIDICIYLLDFNLLPHTNIGILSHDELKRLKNYNASMGLMLESTSKKLFEKGGVHERSPGKIPEKRMEHITNAGKLKIPFTTGLLLGIGENVDDRINDLFLIKNIHEKYGHIQEIILQNFIYKEGIPYRPEKPISIEEILKIVGIAKIIFKNEIPIQVAPNLIAGFERDFIDMCINDFGGISPITYDYINPEKPWPQINRLKKICGKNGYRLKERLPIYDKYINKIDFCPENIKTRIDTININD